MVWGDKLRYCVYNQNMILRLNQFFGVIGLRIYQAPKRTFCGVGILIILLFSQLPKTYFDATIENFLMPNSPSKMAYDQFRDQFGREEMVVVLLKPKKSLFDHETLKTLKQIHATLPLTRLFWWG